MYLGPPRSSLLDGLALRAYDAGYEAALRCISRYGLAWSEDVDKCFERWQTDDTRKAGGWFSQGWDDCWYLKMQEVTTSVA